MSEDLRRLGPRVYTVKFGSTDISFSIQFRKRKTLAISVHPDASVTVAAPDGQSVVAICAKVRKRAGWIVKQQSYFAQFLPKPPPRRYVSGETHRYLGRQYRLKVSEGAEEHVSLTKGYLRVSCRDRRNIGRIKALVEGWYRRQGEEHFQASLVRTLKTFSGASLAPPVVKIKRMAKRWGSCTGNGIIYLNPDLVKAPKRCIDYVMAHEICHLKHRRHSKEFFRMLKRVMSDWEERKRRLEEGW